MKFSWSMASFTNPHEVIELARVAEESGFHAVAFGEHLVHPLEIESDYPYKARPAGPPTTSTSSEAAVDPVRAGIRTIDENSVALNLWATAGAVLAATTQIKFMSTLALLPLRHPLVAANAAATLAGLSNNRFVFGVGLGWMREEYDALGVPWRERAGRFDEALEIMDRAWRGVSEPYEGKYFSFEAMGTNPTPPAPIPLYFGGHSEPMLKRAALRGDGWICAPKPGLAKEQMQVLREMRRSAGVDARPFELVAMLKEPDPSLVGELAGFGIDHFVFSSPWRPDLGHFDPADKIDALKELAAKARRVCV